MKFVDEAFIEVTAGKGGDGCMSFHREKFVPKGGPDGGDGGHGGSIYLLGERNLNTLIDFRYQRLIKAQKGANGMGSLCSGKSGEDSFVAVPVGTSVYDADTDELIGDITEPEQAILVAKGGFGGRGNATFKSSTNRAPRKFTKGTPGEQRRLRLELKVLADVGLLGLPNAGKSTFIRGVSAATPKVADYPFTTLYPHLGVVRVNVEHSFVVADIPGLIEGAAEGAGLGVQFLKHLARTRILLHLVDVLPQSGNDPVADVITITEELSKYHEDLMHKPRWLVLNKVELLPDDQRQIICDDIIARLEWTDPVFQISALAKRGLEPLIYALNKQLQPE